MNSSYGKNVLYGKNSAMFVGLKNEYIKFYELMSYDKFTIP